MFNSKGPPVQYGHLTIAYREPGFDPLGYGRSLPVTTCLSEKATAASLLSVCCRRQRMGGSQQDLLQPLRQRPKLKPSIKAKGKNYPIRVNFFFFPFIVGGNYRRAVGSSILVESWWSMELAFSEGRPREPEEQQELGRGCRKALR